METIKSKRILHSKIKELLASTKEESLNFPVTLDFCEGMGHANYVIKIDRNEEDHFIDDKGQKWVKA
jgi:hypothetical protein